MISPTLKINKARYDGVGNFMFDTNIGTIAMDMADMIEIFSTYADSRTFTEAAQRELANVIEGMWEYKLAIQKRAA